jgi:hypothetical protein
MSQENVELHRRSIDAFNRRDLDAFLALMDDDVEVVSRIVAMEGGLHGRAGARRWWDEWLAAFPDYTVETYEVRDLGALTVAAMRAVGHGAGSEVPLGDTFWLAIRWRHEKAVWWRVFNTWQEALEAVGLSEQDTHADS